MTRNRTAVALVAVLLILVAAAVLYFQSNSPSVSQFAYIREPRLARMEDQRVMIAEATGAPKEVAGRAIGSLFKAYYKLEGVSKMQRPPAPRARWPDVADTPKDKWIGTYAMPVPEAVGAAPADSGLTIGNWAYGEVAEVLHIGPYNAEQPTIERLMRFITSKGYRVIGDHEEEYVKGPGMLFAGDPNDYLTIIRLRVAKANDRE